MTLAEATFRYLVDPEANGNENRIRTPIRFWTVFDDSADEIGGGCANGVDIALTLYGTNAGLILAGSGDRIETFEAAEADRAALSEFQGRLARARDDGFVTVEETLKKDLLSWVGTRRSSFPHCGVITCRITARRGPARQDDPEVLALAALLKAAKPPLPELRARE